MTDREAVPRHLDHRDDLVRYASRVVGSQAVAEDVVQEAYLRLSVRTGDQAQDRIVEPVRYLYRVVRNLALDWIRRPGPVLESELAEDGLSNVPAARPSPEDDTIWRQQVAIVEAALASLPERTRLAFEMHRLGGYTLQQVADELGISVTRAHQLVKQAMARCADRLDGDADGRPAGTPPKRGP